MEDYLTSLKLRSMVENAEELKKDLSHLNEQSGPFSKLNLIQD